MVAEQHKVFEGRVEMRLQTHFGHLLKMVTINMRIHAEQTLENLLECGVGPLAKLYSQGSGEVVWVVKLALNPRHQVFNVFGGAQSSRLLELLAGRVLPQVFVLFGSNHLGARPGGAQLIDGSVEHVNLVVKINHVDRNPLVFVLSRGELDGRLQGVGPQSRGCVLLESRLLLRRYRSGFECAGSASIERLEKAHIGGIRSKQT